jgi:hypothetical protein
MGGLQLQLLLKGYATGLTEQGLDPRHRPLRACGNSGCQRHSHRERLT